MSHNSIPDANVADLEKLASILSQTPYHMAASANHLRKWVAGNFTKAPMLDVSYCAQPSLEPSSSRSSTSQGSHHQGQEVLNLEPQYKPVHVKSSAKAVARRGRTQWQDVSDRAKFVYATATDAMYVHDLAWEDALSLAETCWNDLCNRPSEVREDLTSDIIPPPEDMGEEAECDESDSVEVAEMFADDELRSA